MGKVASCPPLCLWHPLVGLSGVQSQSGCYAKNQTSCLCL